MLTVHRFDSIHLARNLLGNPSERDLAVYLPPSYHTSNRRYPVVYLLHGFSTRSTFWGYGPALAFGAFQPDLMAMLDEAMLAGDVAEMIVVMPDGWSKFGCSSWCDSVANGEFEQYVAREVVTYTDRHFRTLPTRKSRGLTGNSAGASGTWHIGSRNPGVFGAMALLGSGGNYALRIPPTFYRYYDSIYPNEPAGPIDGAFDSWFCYGWSSAFTPNPNKPPYYCDFPFDYPSGEIIPELWGRWLAHDPTVNWPERVENLRQMRGILLDVGWRDEHDLHYVHRTLSRGLTSAGVSHDVEEFDGPHTTHVRERVIFALRWFSQVLDLGAHQPGVASRTEGGL